MHVLLQQIINKMQDSMGLKMCKVMQLNVRQMLIFSVIWFLTLSIAYAVPVGMEQESVEFDDLLNSKELSRYSRDLFGSVISAVRAGDNKKAKLLIRRVLSAYPEHPVAWEFDGTLKLIDNDIKGAERSLIKSLSYMPERASARAKMALVRLAQHNIDGAKKLFQEALSQNPDNWIAHRYLAKLTSAEGNTQQAVKHYSSIVRIGAGEFTPLHAAYARELVRLKRYEEMIKLLAPLTSSKTDPELTLLLAEAYMSQGKNAAARQQLELAKQISPEDARIALFSAIDLRLSGEAQQSVKKLEQLIANNSKNALFHYHHGLALLEKDNVDQASGAFENAVVNSPQSSSLRIMLAREFETLKQPGKVIKTLEPLVKTQTRKDIVYILVQAYANSGKWEKALMHTNNMIEKHPEFVPARLLKIEIFRGLNQLEAAEEYALKTINLFPGSSNAVKSYVQLLFQNNTQDEALLKLKQIAGKQPKSRVLAFILANHYEAANHPAQAEKIYRKLLKETPGDAGILNNLAVALSQQTGKLDEALKLSKQAHQQMPNNAAITDSYGWILHLANQQLRAYEILKLALKQNPEMLEAQCHLGLVLHKQGNKNVELLEKCLQPVLNSGLQALAQQALDA